MKSGFRKEKKRKIMLLEQIPFKRKNVLELIHENNFLNFFKTCSSFFYTYTLKTIQF